MKIRFFFLNLCALLALNNYAYSKDVIELFNGPLNAYYTKHYSGKNIIKKAVSDKNEHIITHISDHSASGLFQKININLKEKQMNYLNFEWKVKKIKNIDETKKEYHDFPARIYLTFKSGLFPWNRYYVNYVFSVTQFKGTHWKSPYLNIFTKSYDVALNGVGDPEEYWIKHKIDLSSDLNKFWNIDTPQLESVAIMVDTDNTKTKTTTSFKNIYLSQY